MRSVKGMASRPQHGFVESSKEKEGFVGYYEDMQPSELLRLAIIGMKLVSLNADRGENYPIAGRAEDAIDAILAFVAKTNPELTPQAEAAVKSAIRS